MVVPETASTNWTAESHSLKKHIRALVVVPTEDAIVYIRSKRKWKNFSYSLQTTLYYQTIRFTSDGNISLEKHKKWRLRDHFLEGDSISVSQPAHETFHIFITHCKGAAERIPFDRSTFWDTLHNCCGVPAILQLLGAVLSALDSGGFCFFGVCKRYRTMTLRSRLLMVQKER
jgi:hypothetical protein